MKAIGHLGYLHSPELLADIISKIPESMIQGYNRFYHEKNALNSLKLAILAEFLRFEADIACRAGTSTTMVRTARRERSSRRLRSREEERRYEYRPRRESVLATREGDRGHRTSYRGWEHRDDTRNKECLFCRSNRHSLVECDHFKKEPVRKRWDWVKSSGACFRCLRRDHVRNRCTAGMCSSPGCNRSHHILLHSESRSRSPRKNTQTPGIKDRSPTITGEAARKETTEEHAAANTWESKTKHVLLKVLPVKLRGPKGSAVAYALLDGGSTITLIDADLAREIGVTGEIRVLNIHGVNRMQNALPDSRDVSFLIGGASGGERMYDVTDARTIPNLSLPCQSLLEEDLKGHRHLENVAVHHYQQAAPKVLIGQDNWDLITPMKIRSANRTAPVASRTPLGWVMHGYATSSLRERRGQSVLPSRAACTDLDERKADSMDHGEADQQRHDIVKMGFALEAMGILTVTRKITLIHQAEQTIENTARRRGGRWEIGLLWKHNQRRFPDTYTNALNRLKAIKRKMKKEPEFGVAYRREVQQLLERGYAQKIDSFRPDASTWFLPHFGVTNPNKPGKLRLVFDAASRIQGLSLNDHLLSGPDLLNSLLGVLMRFRQREVAFTADITEMFLQIKIRDQYRAAQTFLWRDGDSERKPDAYQMTSMIFGASSSPASALFMKNRNAQEYASEYPRAVEGIVRRHYMDDYLDSVDTVEEGVKIINDVINIHRSGGFDMRAWTSNKPKALEHLPEEKRSKGTVRLNPDRTTGERTLGLIWRPDDDTLTFAIDLTRTRSEILSGAERPYETGNAEAYHVSL